MKTEQLPGKLQACVQYKKSAFIIWNISRSSLASFNTYLPDCYNYISLLGAFRSLQTLRRCLSQFFQEHRRFPPTVSFFMFCYSLLATDFAPFPVQLVLTSLCFSENKLFFFFVLCLAHFVFCLAFSLSINFLNYSLHFFASLIFYPLCPFFPGRFTLIAACCSFLYGI